MIIKKIKINGFGKLEDKDIEFKRGINLVVGKNEAGKSTLLKFITSMFYGIPRTKNGKSISDYERYKPWEKDSYSGKLEYELDNKEEFEIYREFKKKNPILYDKNKNDVTKNYSIDTSKGSMFFFEQTGVKEENFFASSAVEQEGVQLSDKARSSVIQKLSNIVLSGNENTSYNLATERIARKQMEEIGTNRSSGRPINIVEKQIEELEKEKNEIEKYKDFKYQIKEKNEKLQKEIIENDNILNILRDQKVNLEKTKLDEEKLKLYEQAIVKEENEIIDKEKELEDMLTEANFSKIKTNKTIYFVSIIMFIVILLIAMLTKQILISVFEILPIVLIIAKIIKNNKIKRKNEDMNKDKQARKRIIEDEIRTIKNERDKKQSELNNKKQEVEKTKNENIIMIKNKYNNLIENADIEDILSTSYEKIVEYIDEKEREKADYRVREKTIDIENDSIMKKVDRLVDIDEELEKLNEKKSELVELNNTYEIIKVEIDNAYNEMKERITPTFIQDLKDILKIVTKGKYTNAYIDNENNILIETKNGVYQQVDRLSTGTIDLIYLALRISAAKEISDETIPIIMDESFAYYDSDRMREIIKYLNTLGGRQVIIFSCSEREQEILEREGIKYNCIFI